MALFFKAEACAFSPGNVRKSFKDVGLWPWNPEAILQAAREHSPTFPKIEKNSLVQEVLEKVKEVDEKKKAEVTETISKVKRVRAPFMKKGEKRNAREEEVPKNLDEEDQEENTPVDNESRSTSIEPRAKRKRTLTTACKTCAAKECQKTLFWSKKWISCPKCNITFCPLHAHLMQQHTC